MADSFPLEYDLTNETGYFQRESESVEREGEVNNEEKEATCYNDLPRDIEGGDDKYIKGLDTVYASRRTFCKTSSYGNDEDNFLRICLLLCEPVKKAVLHQFKTSFRELCEKECLSFTDVLNKYRSNVLDNMARRKLINDDHLKLMFPDKTPPDMKTFDLSLMTSVLLTFDEKGIHSLDEQTKNDLKYVRTKRNETIAHGTSTARSDDFTGCLLDELTLVVKRLGSDDHVKECQSLKTATSVRSRKEITEYIDNSSEDLKRNTKEQDTQHEGNDIENFVRICLLMTQIVPGVVRSQFKKMFSDTELNKELEDLRKMKNVEFPLRKTGIITSVDDLDVPLMLFLMTHARRVEVLQNVIPDPSDVNIHADMTRINYYTNFIIDNRKKGLSSSDDFEKIWKTVSGVISRLGNSKMKHQCASLKESDIDETNKELMLKFLHVQHTWKNRRKSKNELQQLLNELQNNVERIEEYKNSLLKETEIKNRIVDEWVVDDKQFIETKASKELLRLLKTKETTSVTVVGSLGVGKTFTTRHVALQLKEMGYRVLPVSSLSDIMNLYDDKILFIIDDFCGKSVVKENDVKMWLKLSRDFLGRGSKIVVCCSLVVFRHPSFKSLTFFYERECNMNKDFKVTKDELTTIAKQNNMDTGLIYDFWNSCPCFPLLCREYSKSEKVKKAAGVLTGDQVMSEIVKRVLKSELDTYFKEDKGKYTALALIVQCENEAKRKYFTVDAAYATDVLIRDNVDETITACGFENCLSRLEIERALNLMEGTFIIKDHIAYSTINKLFFDPLVSYFKKQIPLYFHGTYISRKDYSKLRLFLNYIDNYLVQKYKNTVCTLIMLCIGVMVIIYIVCIF